MEISANWFWVRCSGFEGRVESDVVPKFLRESRHSCCLIGQKGETFEQNIMLFGNIFSVNTSQFYNKIPEKYSAKKWPMGCFLIPE